LLATESPHPVVLSAVLTCRSAYLCIFVVVSLFYSFFCYSCNFLLAAAILRLSGAQQQAAANDLEDGGQCQPHDNMVHDLFTSAWLIYGTSIQV
jgi:hypothetical protein